MLVSDILNRKGGEVVAIGAETPLATAIGTMVGAAIGALVVEDGAGDLGRTAVGARSAGGYRPARCRRTQPVGRTGDGRRSADGGTA